MANAVGGIAGWLLARLRPATRVRRRLALVERIALAPRQSLALVEAEGRRILVATSAEGAPAFFPLQETSGRNDRAGSGDPIAQRETMRAERVSW